MQRNFTDTDGRKWMPKLTLFEAARIKRQLDTGTLRRFFYAPNL